jgi:hypothetical protein
LDATSVRCACLRRKLGVEIGRHTFGKVGQQIELEEHGAAAACHNCSSEANGCPKCGTVWHSAVTIQTSL